ncbi:MAG: hypothetical protein WA857_04925 [Candidatus Acidiferrum sp.]
MSHSCSGIPPPATEQENTAPPPGMALGYYLRLAYDVARWDGPAIRRSARDTDSLFYGAVFCAITAALIFLATALPRMLRDPAANQGKFLWELVLGLLFVWLSLGLIAFVQIGLCHLVAKWFLCGRGTWAGVTRPLLLGWFVNLLYAIPVIGPAAAAIAWTAVMARIFEEADGISRLQGFLICGGINAIFLAAQYILPH